MQVWSIQLCLLQRVYDTVYSQPLIQCYQEEHIFLFLKLRRLYKLVDNKRRSLVDMSHWKEECIESRGFSARSVTISTWQQKENQLKSPLVNGSLFLLSIFNQSAAILCTKLSIYSCLIFYQSWSQRKKCYKTLQRKLSFQNISGTWWENTSHIPVRAAPVTSR